MAPDDCPRKCVDVKRRDSSPRDVSKNEVTFRVLLVIGILLAASYGYSLIALVLVNSSGGTIGDAIRWYIFFFSVAPVLTIAGVVLIVIAFYVRNKGKK